MVIFHLEDCPHSLGESPPPQTPQKAWTVFFIPFFSSLAAMKKVFSDNIEIQQTVDEGFVVLNLVVSQKTLCRSLELSPQALNSAGSSG